eukprot:ctg_1879.g563
MRGLSACPIRGFCTMPQFLRDEQGTPTKRKKICCRDAASTLRSVQPPRSGWCAAPSTGRIRPSDDAAETAPDAVLVEPSETGPRFSS